MDAVRYARVRELFAAALELGPEERSAFLATACGGDGPLAAEVEALLAADRDAGRFLDPPARAEDGGRDPHAGRRIGAYRLERCLGRGGMGAVYLAVRADREFRQTAAVKLLRAGMDSDEIVRRFKTERQILAGLDHPHIARLLDGGTTADGQPYFVMEYVDGEPIDAYCEARGLGTGERLELFCRVSAAVHFAHQNLVVHRDLKPSNILVSGDGTPKLLDFGIAKLLAPERFSDDTAPTATALRAMTPEYASPEQIQGATVTTATDVYSLGVVLFRLLTGSSPYRPAGSPAEMVERICRQEPERPSTAVTRRGGGDKGGDPDRLRRRLAGDLDTIVLKALEKEPRRRYASVEQLADDVRRHLEGRPVRARRATAAYRLGKFVRRHRLAVAVVAALFAVNLLFGAVMALQRSAIASERDRARQEQGRAERVSSFLVDLFEVADPYQPSTAPPDARQLLDRGAERLAAELEDQPATRADLQATIGAIYRRLGLGAEALPLLESSLDIRRRIFGERHPKVADSLQQLAALWSFRGDYERAEETFRQALAMRRELLGEVHPDVAESLSGLAQVLKIRGEIDAAEPLYRQALAIRREVLGDRRPEVADSLTSLANLLWSRAEYGAVESLYREATAIYRQAFGDDHPKVALGLGNLALTLANRGDYAAAEPLYREALAIRRRLLGADHPEVTDNLTKLAALLHATGEHAEAEALYRQALAGRRRLLGDDHQQVAVTLVNLAELLQAEGRYAEAEAQLFEGIGIFRRSLGEGHPYVGRGLVALAKVQRRRGEAAAAEARLHEALEIFRRQPGGQERAEASALVSLAGVLLDRGEAAAAEGHARAALWMLREILPEDHPQMDEAQAVLAECLAAL